MPFPLKMRRNFGNAKNWTCQYKGCFKKFSNGWLMEFHHKVPTSNGGRDTYKNMEMLCVEHHLMRHKQLRKAGLDHPSSVGILLARLKRTQGGRTDKWREQNG